jgi:WhiB family redox-sensing transcriptional regulator
VSAEWLELAACRHKDSSLFFPEHGGDCTEAKAICADCPVSHHCLTYAIANHIDDGIWGGESPKGRRRLRRSSRSSSPANLRPRFAVDVPTHGVRAGYCAGCRCLACTDANRAYEQTRRKASA